MLEGGSCINNSFLCSDLIDELSLVVAPVIAGYKSKSLFEFGKIKDFELVDSKIYDDGVIWLNYKKK